MLCNKSQSPLIALIEQIGGESQLYNLIMTFSESALQDLDLEVALKGMDAEELADQITNLIKRVFGYKLKSSLVNSTIRNQILMTNYALFELGLSRFQLRKLQLHFAAALRDSMVEGEVFGMCRDRFAEICKMFDEENKGPAQRSTAMSIDPARIMMVRAASSRSLERAASSRSLNRAESSRSLNRAASSRSLVSQATTVETKDQKGRLQRSSSSRSILDDRAKILMARAASNRRLLPKAA
ncbi:unnamed protein product [Cylindrotheca closterium]|uniref:Uncharacterized protein n=1 Tax=Cylindrotheca closterium TaxID=2856 RepID=A0AAD2GF57_9STRA|nr:unnamed protein product [Cylindrotheca closterium]